MFSHGLGPALAALKKKRKKFSASRASNPSVSSTINPTENVVQPIASVLASKMSKMQLQRASSVPTRGPDLAMQSIPPQNHDVTQSQQPSLDAAESISTNDQGVYYFQFSATIISKVSPPWRSLTVR